MKKWKSFLAMVAFIFLMVCVYSCQVNDSDDYFLEAESNMTPADLFISSESYQNLEKEIRKDIRRRINAINKLFEEGKKQYQQLMEQLLKPETRIEAKEQLNALLGYDEQVERNRIKTMALNVYGGANVSRLDLLKAWQKRQMHQVIISTRTDGSEAFEACMKKCNQSMEREVNACYAAFNDCLENVPAEEKLHQSGFSYDACKDSHDFCLDVCYFELTVCRDGCLSLNNK